MKNDFSLVQQSLSQFLFSPLPMGASLIYECGLKVDRAIRRRWASQLPRGVISIGNLTVGGTGKTPFLIYLTQELSRRGLKPAILTRGYRGFLASHSRSGEGEPSFQEHEAPSDEIELMFNYLPFIPIGIGENRKKSAHLLLKKHEIDIFLLDDGFQHWPLHRQVGIVLIDATNPWGGGHLLPWGKLRERASELKRATAVVLTRTELVARNSIEQLKNEIGKVFRGDFLLQSRFQYSLHDSKGHERSLRNLQGRNVVALSAIGNPTSFEQALSNEGALVHPVRFTDHHSYTMSDLTSLESNYDLTEYLVVTTEKDWVKIQRLIGPWMNKQSENFFILKVSISMNDSIKKWENLLTFIERAKDPFL